jgi:hypothetical protein
MMMVVFVIMIMLIKRLMMETAMTYIFRYLILGWCVSSSGFCLRRLFPNKNCMLAMYNTSFYSFRFSLSNFRKFLI